MSSGNSEFLESIWASCEELRGGLETSRFGGYVLALLFVKILSSRSGDDRLSPVVVPEGSSFADLVALKGRPDIGEKINTKILAPLSRVNHLSGLPDFSVIENWGPARERVSRLSRLIAIFEDPRSIRGGRLVWRSRYSGRTLFISRGPLCQGERGRRLTTRPMTWLAWPQAFSHPA